MKNFNNQYEVFYLTKVMRDILWASKFPLQEDLRMQLVVYLTLKLKQIYRRGGWDELNTSIDIYT